jgi:hypothetical protein
MGAPKHTCGCILPATLAIPLGVTSSWRDGKPDATGAGMFPSVLLPVAAVLLVILLAPSPVNVVRVAPKERNLRNRILLQPIPAPSKGGGGGPRWPNPPSRSERPRYALRQFSPAMIMPADPALNPAIKPTKVLDVCADLKLPSNCVLGGWKDARESKG